MTVFCTVYASGIKQQARYAVGRCLMLWSSNDVTQQGSRPKTKLCSQIPTIKGLKMVKIGFPSLMIITSRCKDRSIMEPKPIWRLVTLLTTGFISHFEDGRILKHIYFSALMEPAVWGAELAMSLSGLEGRGYIYIVEPTGPFEDDPNLTNKNFPVIQHSPIEPANP